MIEHNVRIGPDNVIELLAQYDIVVDGADNFPTRYLLNDASVRLNKPVVSASILAFDGQISTFVPHDGPCYRCLYPTPPPPELAPSCGAAGVLGMLPGVMGLMQSLEVFKLVTGAGRAADGPPAPLRGARHDVHRAQGQEGPDLPDLRPRRARGRRESELGKFPDYEAFCSGAAVA